MLDTVLGVPLLATVETFRMTTARLPPNPKGRSDSMRVE
jgi:hypothetical protein